MAETDFYHSKQHVIVCIAFWVTYNNLYKHNIMAVAFETVNVILTEEQTEHINVQHVDHHQHMKSSKFFISLNLKPHSGLVIPYNLGRKRRRHCWIKDENRVMDTVIYTHLM